MFLKQCKPPISFGFFLNPSLRMYFFLTDSDWLDWLFQWVPSWIYSVFSSLGYNFQDKKNPGFFLDIPSTFVSKRVSICSFALSHIIRSFHLLTLIPARCQRRSKRGGREKNLILFHRPITVSSTIMFVFKLETAPMRMLY